MKAAVRKVDAEEAAKNLLKQRSQGCLQPRSNQETIMGGVYGALIIGENVNFVGLYNVVVLGEVLIASSNVNGWVYVPYGASVSNVKRNGLVVYPKKWTTLASIGNLA